MIMMRYAVYRTGGVREAIDRGKPLSLKQLQEIVGGYIEFVPATVAETGEQLTVCVNEEGRLKGLKPNPFLPGIVGDAVVGQIVQGADGAHFVGYEVVE